MHISCCKNPRYAGLIGFRFCLYVRSCSCRNLKCISHIFLASNPRDIKVPGRDAKGIYFAVDFLKKVTKTLLDSDFTKAPYEEARGKHVLVIGGGDTGNDCVGTSVRLGAKSVTQLEMMPMPTTERAASNPWPEWPKVLKTDYGQEEAIAVFGHDPRIYQTTVTEFIKDKNGNVCQAKSESNSAFVTCPRKSTAK